MFNIICWVRITGLILKFKLKFKLKLKFKFKFNFQFTSKFNIYLVQVYTVQKYEVWSNKVHWLHSYPDPNWSLDAWFSLKKTPWFFFKFVRIPDWELWELQSQKQSQMKVALPNLNSNSELMRHVLKASGLASLYFWLERSDFDIKARSVLWYGAMV